MESVKSTIFYLDNRPVDCHLLGTDCHHTQNPACGHISALRPFATAALCTSSSTPRFLARVQIAVYAGGIVVLFVFAILLTIIRGDNGKQLTSRKNFSASHRRPRHSRSLRLGTLLTLNSRHCFTSLPSMANRQCTASASNARHKLRTISSAVQAVSVLLLACIIGGVVLSCVSSNSNVSPMDITLMQVSRFTPIVMFLLRCLRFLTRRNMIAILISLDSCSIR